jgi:soluble lytic murein transglycosylase
MQLRELAAVEWASAERISSFEMEHLLDPDTNTLAGTWYLARLLKRYQQTDNPVPYALADYNAGRANVRRWLKDNAAATTNSTAFRSVIGYPMTRRYVESILNRRELYRHDFPLMSLGAAKP